MRLPKITFHVPRWRNTAVFFPSKSLWCHKSKLRLGPQGSQTVRSNDLVKNISTPRDAVIAPTWKHPLLFFLNGFRTVPLSSPPPAPGITLLSLVETLFPIFAFRLSSGVQFSIISLPPPSRRPLPFQFCVPFAFVCNLEPAALFLRLSKFQIFHSKIMSWSLYSLMLLHRYQRGHISPVSGFNTPSTPLFQSFFAKCHRY